MKIQTQKDTNAQRFHVSCSQTPDLRAIVKDTEIGLVKGIIYL